MTIGRQDVEQAIRAYAAAWAANDRAAWLETFAPDATQEDPVGDGVRRGREEIGQFWDGAMSSYRSLEIVPREIFVVGAEAVMVWTINGVVEGGPIMFDGVDVFTFDDRAKITSVRAYWERAAMLEQRQALQ